MGQPQSDISEIIEAMQHHDLIAYRDLLDERIRGDKATLEDFGRLSRVLQELSRRDASTGDVRTI